MAAPSRKRISLRFSLVFASICRCSTSFRTTWLRICAVTDPEPAVLVIVWSKHRPPFRVLIPILSGRSSTYKKYHQSPKDQSHSTFLFQSLRLSIIRPPLPTLREDSTNTNYHQPNPRLIYSHPHCRARILYCLRPSSPSEISLVLNDIDPSSFLLYYNLYYSLTQRRHYERPHFRRSDR